MGMGLEKLLGKRIRKRMGKGRKEQERRRKEMGKEGRARGSGKRNSTVPVSVCSFQ
jgi:hypothetical protein